jgi:hypothetical protein
VDTAALVVISISASRNEDMGKANLVTFRERIVTPR